MSKLAISISLLFFTNLLFGQNNKEQSSLNGEIQLDEVTVTSSRVAIPIAQTPKLITIFSKEDIKKAQVTSVMDLLAYAVNIDVLQRSPHGAQADISLRGGSFDQTAVLLNGINVSNAQTGHYSFDFPINISDIERIEIIHGPSALIYGSSAFSGGVNIITKKNSEEKAFVQVGAGMHNLRYMEARGSVATGIVSNSLSVSSSSSDGYIHNTDYNIYNVLLQSRINLRGNNKLDLQLGYNDKKYGANSFYTAAHPNQYEQTSTYLSTIKGEFGSTLKFIPMVYWSRHADQFDLTKDSPVGRNYHRGDTYGANLILQYKSRFGTTNVGGEVRKEDMLSSKLGKEMTKPHGKYKAYIDRTNVSATLEHTLTLDKLVLSGGALINYNTFISGKYKVYPSLSASYRPWDSFTIASSWSKSTRMPTFTELFYNTETHIANDNLLPEKSESTDLTFRYRHSIVEFSATGFLLWGKNMIDWVKEDKDSKPTSTNITRINSQGVESNLKLYLSTILPILGENPSLTLGYMHMWQDYDTNEYISESKNKLNYLRDKFTIQFNHKIINRLTANWFFRTQKRMGRYSKYVDNKNTGELVSYASFSTLDLKLDYKIEKLTVHLSMNNLYNKKYIDYGNIEQPGFWLSGGLSYALR